MNYPNFFWSIVLLLPLQLFSQDAITVCWDNSMSMKQRDIEKDFLVLEKIFEKNPDQKVQLLLFNMLVEEKNYTITEGDWSSLKKDLLNTDYDGATVYSNLKNHVKNPQVYVFTDGKRIFSNDIMTLKKGDYIINSNPNANSEFLKKTALIARSGLIDFAALGTRQMPVSDEETSNPNMIKGTIYIDNKPTSNIRVAQKGKPVQSTLTDEEGTFFVTASAGDTLLIEDISRNISKTVVLDGNSELRIFLNRKITALDEVVVTEKPKEEKMVTTAWGKKNENAIGYSVKTISGDDLLDVHDDGSMLQGKVPGLEVNQTSVFGVGAGVWSTNGGLRNAMVRGRSSFQQTYSTLIVIDGVPLAQSRQSGKEVDFANLTFLNRNNIAEITVLKSLAATNIYGDKGNNGAILIKTKTSLGGPKEGNQIVDHALVKNNDYIENEAGLTKTTSPILEALSKLNDPEKAYNTYLSLREINPDDLDLYLSAVEYFGNRDVEKAKRIISNLLEITPNEKMNLRSVAMVLTSLNEYEASIPIYKELINKYPTEVQAYLDLALAKKNSGELQKALDEMIDLVQRTKYPNLNIQGISKTLDREIKDLVFRHGDQLDLSRVNQRYLKNIKYDARILLEWNNSLAEFEVQFVNPQNKFFKWEHSNAADGKRITDELEHGFSSEEFEIYGDAKGKWIINVKYLGGPSKSGKGALVLKCTVQEKFGSIEGSSETILTYFSNKNEKRNLKTLVLQ